MTMDSDRYSLVALSVTIGISLLSFLYYVWFHRRRSPNCVPVTDETAPTSKSTVESSSVQRRGGGASDVWEERRRRGIQAASMHVKPDVAKDQKPFGSSYYYAHNSTKAAGGYKDGLTMEDFTMNGPRLLRRNGQPVDDHELPSPECTTAPPVPDSTGRGDDDAPKNPLPSPRRTTILIHRYLWDDPGNGVGTIRIDVLPSVPQHREGTTTMPWSTIRCSVTNVSATLISNNTTSQKEEKGLLLEIEACHELEGVVVYTLRLPRLYGPVDKVEAMNKEKRLLIRLYKASTWLDKTNLQSWPHPQKTI
jgi:hypothetical protein